MSSLIHRIVTLAAPPRAIDFGLGLNAVVVLVEAPRTIPMSLEGFGVGGGAFWLDGEVELLLHPATTPRNRGDKNNRRARIGAPRGKWETGSRRLIGETMWLLRVMGRQVSG
jgi:hypothetical protein